MRFKLIENTSKLSNKIWYHNTPSDLTRFDLSHVGTGAGTSYGEGIYFSSEPVTEYGKTIEVKLDIERPLVINNIHNLDELIKFLSVLDVTDTDDITSYYKFYDGNGKATATKMIREYEIDVAKELSKNNYDCILIRNADVGIKSHKTISEEAVIFDINKIKIVGSKI